MDTNHLCMMNLMKNFSKANRPKKFSIFKERRFALLGYTAAAQIHHFQDFMNTLTNINSRNQLVQACKLYLQVDYVNIALKCIAWFTYKITLPLLNMCEQETPKALLVLLPNLWKDLDVGKMDTLLKYKVDYSFSVEEPTTELGKLTLQHFCKQAATDLARQGGR